MTSTNEERDPQKPISLDEISGPIYQKFLESGLTDEQLGDLLEREKHEARAHRRERRASWISARVKPSAAAGTPSLPRYSGGGLGWGFLNRIAVRSTDLSIPTPLPNPPPDYRGREIKAPQITSDTLDRRLHLK